MDLSYRRASANNPLETATTPPIATSPGDYESMDISPLPHKAPFSVQIKEVHSPCPSQTSESELSEAPKVQEYVELLHPSFLRRCANHVSLEQEEETKSVEAVGQQTQGILLHLYTNKRHKIPSTTSPLQVRSHEEQPVVDHVA